jgi:hypothetical protein
MRRNRYYVVYPSGCHFTDVGLLRRDDATSAVPRREKNAPSVPFLACSSGCISQFVSGSIATRSWRSATFRTR